jgi:ABC-2 type transport system permease protein
MAYGVDGLRAAFIGLSHIGVATDVVVLFVVATLFLVMGARAFSKIQI